MRCKLFLLDVPSEDSVIQWSQCLKSLSARGPFERDMTNKDANNEKAKTADGSLAVKT